MLSVLVLCAALALDKLLGEPKRFHPLVGFGNIATRIEFTFNNDGPLRFIWGLIALILLCALPALIVYGVSQTLGKFTWLMDLIIVYLAIGFNSLLQHSSCVESALKLDGLAEAREKVAMMVSRDTHHMDTSQVASAAIESTLENGSDSTYAVIFWYFVGGAPFVVLYRLVNTLDAMWGYRTERYEQFGKAAARVDDLLNIVPARITAILYALSGDAGRAFASWRTQASLLASPNGGPVMSAGAGSLNLKLGGPTYYHGSQFDKPFFGGEERANASDIERANRLVTQSLIYWLILISVFALLLEVAL